MKFLNILLSLLQIEPISTIKWLDELARQGPLITLFVLITVYLIWQIQKKEKDIEDCYKYIRDSDKENIHILNEVNATLDKVLENQKYANDSIIREISNLKEYLNIKLKGNH